LDNLQKQKVIQLRDSSIMLNFILAYLGVGNFCPDLRSRAISVLLKKENL